ncbi:SAM-dependent methyltransferase [Actinomadura parmotrematis]|uniref:Cyclopropane-fatty-acyl-phospholipid synthase family protein n=1 Tax=Actinomadura parmotrematis TaxID=2864039 RepID=A0ABS7G0V4_9ACTN|nr:cyclopropane-fatty-acyl-phospholipid synthase family protein [Actinomadura parmotrematis]MBW8485499.1 cyclopropane-fatty-acyl-phospholipid synthase family protein [Actinomadura parmotrematis]
MTMLADDRRRRWPDITAVPRAGVRAAVARRLFDRAVRDLPVRILHGPGDLPRGPVPTMRIARPEAFHARVGASGLIGFGESYMARDWETDDLPGLLTAFAARMATLVPPPLQRLRRLAVRPQPPGAAGDPASARRNVARHYDLSNDLFALFLDPTMTYSAALFEQDPAGALTGGLAAAQHRKIDRLLDLTGVGPGTRLLEIGTGWGELALRAGRRGARVRTLTLSAEQRDLALRRAASAGLADRVRVDLLDYRAATGVHDAVLSVEMIEAVGARHWPEYFATLRRLLAPGGRAGLQAITMPHDRMLASRDTHTWVQKYIFPGGLIPSHEAIAGHATAAGLRVTGRADFGVHYAETLRRWRERFLAAAPEVEALGFDATFRRMWELYLAYSEAGFRCGYLDVRQYLMTPVEGPA